MLGLGDWIKIKSSPLPNPPLAFGKGRGLKLPLCEMLQAAGTTPSLSRSEGEGRGGVLLLLLLLLLPSFKASTADTRYCG